MAALTAIPRGFMPLVARYAGPKGNLQFPLSEPIPHALIAKIVRARVKARTKPRKGAPAKAR